MERHQYLGCSAVQKHSGVRCTKDYPANNLKTNDNASAPSGINEGRSDLEFTTKPTDQVDKVTNDNGDTIVSSTDIVQMDNNAKVEHSMLENHTTTMKVLVPTMTSDLDHSIKTFLARPYLIGTYTVTTSTAANSIIAQVNIFSTLMAIPYYANKLRGIAGIRANTHVRVQTNANRFQQGRLLINYFPGLANSTKQRTINDSLMSRTQLPRVESDINTTDECTLSVPFISDRPFYDFQQTAESTGGHVGVVMYSPLLTGSGGETEFQLSMWVHLTDVELFWPGDIVAQSGVVTTSLRKKQGRVNPEAEVPAPHRPISGFLSKVSNSAGILSKIPLLSSIATPVSWTSRILSDAAAAMGWCKPNSCMKERFSVVQTAGWANGSGVNLGENLGLLEDNKVTILEDMAGTNVDQMSIKYPLSIPTWVGTFSVSTSATAGTVVYNRKADPSSFSTPATGAGVHCTPLYYFSRLFQFWRGGIRVRIKAVKTEFHTARFRFVVSPKSVSSSDEMAYYISEIMDIRDASEWTFDVPYMSSLPYLPTNLPNNNPPSLTTTYFGVVLINELRCPETVAQSVNFIVEVCGAEDFELASPCLPRSLYPKASPGGHSNSGTLKVSYQQLIYPSVGYNLFPQGPEDVDAQFISGHFPIANVPIHEPTLEPSKLCIGERVTSLKQLAMRPSLLCTSNRAAFYLFLDNPSLEYESEAVNGFTCFFSATAPTYYDFVRLCYGFYRGGVSVKISNAAPAYVSMANQRVVFDNASSITTANSAQPSNYCAYGTYPASAAGRSSFATPSMIQYVSNTQQVVDVVVPHYSMRPVRRTQNLIDSDFVAYGNPFYSVYDGRTLAYSEASTTGDVLTAKTGTKAVFLAASDDFQCNFFSGCPILTSVPTIVGASDSNNDSGVYNRLY